MPLSDRDVSDQYRHVYDIVDLPWKEHDATLVYDAVRAFLVSFLSVVILMVVF
jgi:hypothetical protein